jgi:ankyrin repeat protein
MDTLPLPPHPDLEQYKQRAKDLIKACSAEDPAAIRAWATEWLETLARLRGIVITRFVEASIDRAIDHIETELRDKRTTGTLADAQFLIARAHGFASWPKFAKHLEGITRRDPETWEFETAADAAVTGDLSTLTSLLRANRALIRARSTRVHRATLLHYVAANGVEDFRQLTPPNAVALARILLQSGAEVDALAETYGGGKLQTTLNLLVSSTHPAEAGLQVELVETLLDFGAAINGLEDDGSPLLTALAFGYGKAAEALARRGARVDNVIAAAALGRVDLVRSFLVGPVTLKPGVPLVSPGWFQLPNDPKRHIELALAWACKFGRTAVVDLLLEQGVDPVAKDSDDMTALHWAAANGSLDVIKSLLRRGAPLEIENRWGGTVLNSTLHFALYQPIEGADYPAVIEILIAAGAEVDGVTPFPTGNRVIDALLRHHGAGST